jgi:hypothetical protein
VDTSAVSLQAGLRLRSRHPPREAADAFEMVRARANRPAEDATRSYLRANAEIGQSMACAATRGLASRRLVVARDLALRDVIRAVDRHPRCHRRVLHGPLSAQPQGPGVLGRLASDVGAVCGVRSVREAFATALRTELIASADVFVMFVVLGIGATILGRKTPGR